MSPGVNTSESGLLRIVDDPEFVDVGLTGHVLVDVRYASTNNFLGRDVYDSFQRAFLHRQAAQKLETAAKLLRERAPNRRLLVLDALRPRSAQWTLWNAVAGTPQEKYVADPRRGSIHNYGLAVDLTLVDEQGSEVDMGTIFDFFGELAEPQHEEKFLASGELSTEQVANRRLLRSVMEEAGFHPIPHEWWHFNAVQRSELSNYRLIE